MPYQETLELLNAIAMHPLDLKRYSTRLIFTFLQKKDTFPFSAELLREYIEEFRSIDEKRDVKCINSKTPVPENFSADNYKSILTFLKMHCDGSEPAELTSLVLNAAKAFVQNHPGSAFHEFMMLRQLRDTLKFTALTAVYETGIIAFESAAFNNVMQIQALLEPDPSAKILTVKQVKRALLSLSDDVTLSLACRKQALLALACYHISTDSLLGTQFNVSQHNKKNFSLILMLSSIQSIESNSSFLAPSQKKIYPTSVLKDARIQIITMMQDGHEVKMAQPKELSPNYWDVCLSELMGLLKDPVIVMTEVLINYHKKNSKIKIAKDNLLAWFETVAQHQRSTEIFVVRKSYSDLYDYLDKIEILPDKATLPLGDLAPTTPSRTSKQVSQPLSPAMQRFMRDPTQVKLIHLEEVGQLVTELTQRVEDGIIKENEATRLREKEIAAKQALVVATPPKKNKNFMPLSAHKDNDEYEPSPVAPTQSGSVMGQDIDWEIDTVVSDYTGDSPFQDYEAFYPESSDFAKDSVRNIGDYSVATSQEKKTEAMKELITRVLAWGESAHTAGLAIVDARAKFQFLMSMKKNETVTLEEIYQQIYLILQIVIHAPIYKSTVVDNVIKFYQDAGAFFVLLRKHIAANNGLEAHTIRLGDKDNFERTVIQQLLYRDESKSINSASLRWHDPITINRAAAHLKTLPLILAKTYGSNIFVTEKVLQQRCYFEAECVDFLVEILNTLPGDLSFEQVALAIWVVKEYATVSDALRKFRAQPVKIGKESSITVRSPFYNALRFLAASYQDYTDENPVVILLDRKRIEIEADALCKRLIEHALPLFPVNDKRLSSPQQIVIYKEIEQFIEKLEPEKYLVDENGNAVNLETRSMASHARSARSHRTARTIDSKYTCKTSGSDSASFMQSIATDVVWESYCAVPALKPKHVKFALKFFANIYLHQEKSKKEESLNFLFRAFEWLREQPSTITVKATGGLTLFGRKEKIDQQDGPSTAWGDMIAYIEKSCKAQAFETFAQYCQYQIDKQKSGYKLKSYELEFMMKNLKFLYRHCFSPESILWNATLNLIYPAINTALTRLEEKSKKMSLESAEVEFYTKMLLDRDGTMICFQEPGKETTLFDRIKTLSENVKPSVASKVSVAPASNMYGGSGVASSGTAAALNQFNSKK